MVHWPSMLGRRPTATSRTRPAAAGSLIYAPTYDAELDANATVPQALAIFRAYATAQLDIYQPSALGATPSGTYGIGSTGTTTIGAGGAAPSAADHTYNFTPGTPLLITAAELLAGSSDPDGDSLVAALAASPVYGTVTVNADGSVLYTPGANWAGIADTFTYQVSDGNGGTALATVTLVPI